MGRRRSKSERIWFVVTSGTPATDREKVALDSQLIRDGDNGMVWMPMRTLEMPHLEPTKILGLRANVFVEAIDSWKEHLDPW